VVIEAIRGVIGGIVPSSFLRFQTQGFTSESYQGVDKILLPATVPRFSPQLILIETKYFI